LGPSDLVTRLCALNILEPGAARERLTPDLAHVDDDRGFARLEKAFALVTAADGIAKRLRTSKLKNWKDAVANGVITQAEGEQLAAAQQAAAAVIAVDDFAPEELSPNYKKPADVHQFFQALGEQRAAS
jgi:acyl-CoA dehydrogenase